MPLRALAVSGSNACVFPLVLGGFTKLTSLTIHMSPLDADMVSALITDNPHLHTLELSSHFGLSFDEMLPSLPPDTDRCLKIITLRNLTILRDNVPLLVPFIKMAIQLALTEILDIPDSIWAELNRLNTPLRTLSIFNCQMNLLESFVDFILFCNGLKQLEFPSARLGNDKNCVMADPCPGIVCRFWINTLPCLASSLQFLVLKGPKTSGLCIQDIKHVDALSNCHLLQVLTVVVNPDLAHTRTVIVNNSSLYCNSTLNPFTASHPCNTVSGLMASYEGSAD